VVKLTPADQAALVEPAWRIVAPKSLVAGEQRQAFARKLDLRPQAPARPIVRPERRK